MRTTSTPKPAAPGERAGERGMLLIEALVAMVIVAMVTISYIGIRTSALIDATRARNWRLAREIAEERLSMLKAGAHEVQPENQVEIPIEKYEGFSFKIVLGENNVTDVEGQIASDAAGDDSEALNRIERERRQKDYRRANEMGLSAQEYEDQQYVDDIETRLLEKAPSADEFEEVAVVVYFPKLDPDYEGQREALLIRARVSTLAISGLTPDQAETMAQAKGQSSDPAAGGNAGAGSNPFGGAGEGR